MRKTRCMLDDQGCYCLRARSAYELLHAAKRYLWCYIARGKASASSSQDELDFRTLGPCFNLSADLVRHIWYDGSLEYCKAPMLAQQIFEQRPALV